MAARPSRPISVAKLIVPLVTLVVALGALIYGATSTSAAVTSLNAALDAGTATATDVYGGQSIIVVYAAVLGAGILGVIVALAAIGVLAGVGGFRAPVQEEFVFDELDLIDDVDDLDEELAEKPVEQPAEKPVEKPAERTAERPAVAEAIAPAPVVAEPAVDEPDADAPTQDPSTPKA
ncbi:hypothetical protein [Agromyces atrinae]|uniref:Dinucleotide-utilizing enzyme n=1 Tax=Agromyces atrinae TaxID=592376 RepID=A0A852SI65_9MICO|nr:hypothetical protein [Agromyces atrinae]NYD68035.1 hypothetical protein [Agromyces atrinae]